MNLLALTTLAVLNTASAGESSAMSDAIVDGRTPVIHGQALSTVCESYSVDEYGNLSSRFVTEFTIWEVVQEGEGGEFLSEGETIDLVWGRYQASPFAEPGGCENPRWSIVPQEVDIVALWIDDGVTYVDAWYEGNAGYETGGGEGELPPCGEDLQQEVIDELRSGDSDDPEEDEDDDPMDEGDAEGASDDGAADDPSAPTGSASTNDAAESDKDASGCSVAGTLTAGHLALGLALVGMARRRRE